MIKFCLELMFSPPLPRPSIFQILASPLISLRSPLFAAIKHQQLILPKSFLEKDDNQ